MKRMLVVLLFTLVCSLYLPSVCLAQFQNHFNVYVTDSFDSTGTAILQTVTVDGYSSVPIGMPSGVLHTPKILNTIGSAGGWSTGQGVCPSCHITYSTTVGLPYVISVVYPGSDDAQIYCTWGGMFFNGGSGGGVGTTLFNWEVAFTRFVTAGYIPDPGPPPARFYFIGQYCSRETTPPDWNGAGLYFKTPDPPLVPTGIVDGKAFCARVGTSGPWTCAPYGKWVGSYDAPYVLGICTHNP